MSSFESTTIAPRESSFQPDVPGKFELDVQHGTSGTDEAEINVQELEANAFAAGQESGVATARSLCQPAIQALSAATIEVASQRDDYLRAQRRLIVDLAIDIAERIVGRAVSENPEWIVERIDDAVAMTHSTNPITVELNPEDQALVGELAGNSGAPGHAQLVANPSLARGEFLVSSGQATIDARLQSQLDEIRGALSGLDNIEEADAAADADGLEGASQ